jgi:3-oxoacyl-[acyl-carrier-protein] synthase-1
MSAADIVIVSAGLITPVGLGLAETAASARARLARLREIDFMDRRFEPHVAGTVPDEGLPELAAPLAAQPLTYRESRMLRLAHAAIEEAAAPLAGRGLPPLPLMLGLPEHHTLQPLRPALFLQRLAMQAPGLFDRGRSLAAPRGRAAALQALPHALARLASGELPALLIGGVDCLVDLLLLSRFEQQGRIRSGINSDGFSPGEGAAVLLLCGAALAAEHGLKPLARVMGAGQGQEPGHLYADDPYLGEGLAAAVASALADAAASEPIQSVWCSFNGERYWAKEFSVAITRRSARFASAHHVEHPAECFGDLGAAHGPALLALAAHALGQRWRPSPALVCASSDHADRGAAVLATA